MTEHALLKFRTIDKKNHSTEYMVVYFKKGNEIGRQLINFIQSIMPVSKYEHFDGFENFLVQYVSLVKNNVGGIGIYPINTIMNEKWNYILTYDTYTLGFSLSLNGSPSICIDKFMDYQDNNYDEISLELEDEKNQECLEEENETKHDDKNTPESFKKQENESDQDENEQGQNQDSDSDSDDKNNQDSDDENDSRDNEKNDRNKRMRIMK